MSSVDAVLSETLAVASGKLKLLETSLSLKLKKSLGNDRSLMVIPVP
jgi:hypothetical protein